MGLPLLGMPLGQHPRLKGFALRHQPRAPGGDALGNLTLTFWVKPCLSILGHIPGAGYSIPMDGHMISISPNCGELISFPCAPALVPQTFVIGLRACGGVAKNRRFSKTATHWMLNGKCTAFPATFCHQFQGNPWSHTRLNLPSGAAAKQRSLGCEARATTASLPETTTDAPSPLTQRRSAMGTCLTAAGQRKPSFAASHQSLANDGHPPSIPIQNHH